MVVIATGSIPFSPLSNASMVIMLEDSKWFEKILCRVLVKRTPGKHEYVHWQRQYNLDNVENGVEHNEINQLTIYS